VRVYDHHACSGKVAVVRINAMPPFSKTATLQPDLAIELSETGAVIRRWSLPVDATVVGVVGERLIVPISSGNGGRQAVSMSSSGDLQQVAVPGDGKPENLIECPTISEFMGSAYVRCFEFTDLTSGQVRRIAYEMPCT
jgi:hypothetical protein